MRRVLAILTVVVLAGVVAFVLSGPKETGDALTAGVEKRLRAGDAEGARAERESVRGRLDAGWNDYLDGIFLLTQGKDREALDALGRARRAHPDSWKITAAAGYAAANAGRASEALAMFESYAAASPDDVRALAEVARWRLDDRAGPPDAAKALAALDRIAALPPRANSRDDGTDVSEALLHRLRAKALLVAGRGVEALDEARAATRTDPRNAESWYLLGDAARLAKPARGGDAIEAYRRAFELSPGDRRYGEQFVMATLTFIDAGAAAEVFSQARAAVDAMLRAAPDDAALLILKARIFARDQHTLDAANDIYAELSKRGLPKEQRLAVLRNRGVLLYDFKVGGRPSPYLKDSYDLLKQYVDEGGVIDDELRDTWSKLQIYAPK